MKLLADLILKQRPIGRGEEHAHTMLRRPASNHAPTVNPVGLCDRFVFDRAAASALRGNVETMNEFLRSLGRIPTPLERAWIEVDGSGAWLIDGRQVYGYSLVGSLGARYIGELNLDDWPGTVNVRLSTFISRLGSAGHTDLQLWSEWMLTVGCALVALASPHAATSRRVMPGPEGGSAQRAFAFRRAQRGCPVFSYNKVDFIRPRAAVHNGVLRSVESVAGQRLHMVVGHWRLIDGVIEPYWIWVEGHTRGNADLGTIIKERHVHLAPNVVRRGFLMPNETGRSGERRAALLPAQAKEMGR